MFDSALPDIHVYKNQTVGNLGASISTNVALVHVRLKSEQLFA